jgi:DNA-binding transcriptional ArsR family regulator
MSTNRILKDALYEQVARIAKAAASPKRLELIELLCQAPKSVDVLAREAGCWRRPKTDPLIEVMPIQN